MPPPAAVIFDVDGTLAETERDGHRVAFNRSFAEAGLPWRWDEALYGELLAVSGGRQRISLFAQRYAPLWLADPRAGERIAALHQRKNAHYAAIVDAGGVRLRPGLPRLLDDLRAAGLRLAIATTTSRTNVETLLRATLGDGAAARFEAIVCGEDVAHLKPDPEAYGSALRRLGLAAARCIAIEDSANGLRAAVGTSIPTLIVRSQYARHEDFRGALRVFDGYDVDGDDADGDRLLSAKFITALV